MDISIPKEQVEYCREQLAKSRDQVAVIRHLRDRFGLGLVDAKRVLVLATQGVSLEEHQEKLASLLEQANSIEVTGSTGCGSPTEEDAEP